MREKLVLHGVRPVFPVNATHAAFRNMPIVSSAIMMHFTGIWKALTEVVAHLRNVSGVIFFFPTEQLYLWKHQFDQTSATSLLFCADIFIEYLYAFLLIFDRLFYIFLAWHFVSRFWLTVSETKCFVIGLEFTQMCFGHLTLNNHNLNTP